MSVNSPIRRLEIAALLLYVFYTSHLQQKFPSVNRPPLRTPNTHLSSVQIVRNQHFISSTSSVWSFNQLLVVLFDSGRLKTQKYLSYLTATLAGPVAEGSIFHTLS